MVDIHSHLLPGIDDGAEDLDASLALLSAYERQGATDVVCTPHLIPREETSFSAPAFQDALDRRDRTLEHLTELAAYRFPGVRLHAGAEIMLSSGLPEILRRFSRSCRLAGSRYVLVETPSFLSGGLHAIDRMLFQIQLEGLVPILAHPERMNLSVTDRTTLADWALQNRLLLQVNASTLLPAESLPVDRRERQRQRQATVRELLAAGVVHLVASDTHGPTVRPPMLSAAYDAIVSRHGRPLADRLFRDNPRRVVEDGDIESIPAAGPVH